MTVYVFTERFFLLLIATAIFAMGLVMIFSTTSAEVLDYDLSRSTHLALFRQLLFACLGLILAFIVNRLGYRQMIAFSPALFVIFTALLALTLVPGIGRIVNGSRRWISIAGFSFQPSELMKLVLPLYYLHTFSKKTFYEFVKQVAIFGIPIVLILVEPNNGTAGVMILSLIVLFFLTEVPIKFWALPLCVFAVLGGAFASQLPYVSARLKVYLHPELDIRGRGHQPYQAKIAAGSGQLFGKGPGNSLQKLSYLPEAQNDYIAAIYAEEWGFLGIAFLILLYMGIVCLGFTTAYLASDWEARALAAVIVFLLCFQAFLNMAVVSGLLPSTGLNLPLFSQGGTSLIANMIGIALLLNINEERNLVYDRTQHRSFDRGCEKTARGKLRSRPGV